MRKSIFVSSTFKDFQVERELILRKIEKEINEELQKKNIGVNFVDLRWGIDTEEGGLKKVITFCIDYVNKSKPYILIMLGDSYGSLVSKELLEPIYNINNLSYDGKEKSVTEVEIESSLLFEGDNQRKIVLNRRITNLDTSTSTIYYDKENHGKLEKLKEKILNVVGKENVYSYDAHLENEKLIIDNPSRFEYFIKNKIIKLIEQDYSKYQNDKFIERVESHSKSFAGREEIETIKKEIYECFEQEEKYYIIQGNPGIGKTSVAAKLKDLLIEDGHESSVYLCDENKEISDLEFIVREMTKQFSDVEKDVFEELHKLNKNKKYFYIIDSADKLVDGNQFDMFINPNIIPENVFFIMLVNNSEVYEYDYELQELEEKDIALVIEKELRQNQKQVPLGFLNYINDNIERFQHFRNPSFLSLFINELCHLKIEEYQALGKQKDFMVGLTSLFMYKIDSFPKTIKEYLDSVSEEALLVFQLLALSNEGLDEEDIRSITWDLGDTYSIGLIKSVVFEFDKSIRKLENGKYTLYNRLLKEEVLKTLNEDEIKFARYQIISSIGARISSLNLPVLKEILYQYYLLEDYYGLASVLSLSYGILDSNDKFKLGIYFQSLTNERMVNECEKTYLNIAKLKVGNANPFLYDYSLNDMSDRYVENSLEFLKELYLDIENQDKQYDANISYYYLASLVSNSQFKESNEVFNLACKRSYNFGLIIQQLRVYGYQFSGYLGESLIEVLQSIYEDKEVSQTLRVTGKDLFTLVEIIVLLEGNALSIPKEGFNLLFDLIHEFYLDNNKPLYGQTMNLLKYLSITTNEEINYPYKEMDDIFGENKTLMHSRVCALSFKHLVINEFVQYMNDEDTPSDRLINIFENIIESNPEMGINDYLITYKIFNRLSLMEELDYEFLVDGFEMYTNRLNEYFVKAYSNTMLNVKLFNSILNGLYYSFLINDEEREKYFEDKLTDFVLTLQKTNRVEAFNSFFNSEIKYYFMDIEGLEKDKEFFSYFVNKFNRIIQ